MKKVDPVLFICIPRYVHYNWHYFCSTSYSKDVDDTYGSKAERHFLVERGIIFVDPAQNFGVNEEITRLEASGMTIEGTRSRKRETGLTELHRRHSGRRRIRHHCHSY